MDINNCSASNCLSNLVSLKSSCLTGNCTPYYIEDLDGIDSNFLSSTANSQQLSAELYAKNLIDTATRIMLGDMEMLLTSGYSLVNAFGETCSACAYLNNFQAGGGAVIRNLVVSKYSVLKVSKIEVNCNATGAQTIVLDDGISVKTFQFQAGGINVSTPVLIDYTTTANSVKVSLQDQSIQLAAIDCAKASGCGCSGSAIPKDTVISYSGLLLGMPTTQQYGFKICANVTCSMDALVCAMVAQTPNIFGLTLLYKVGEIAYQNAPLSTRNNRVAGFDEEKQQSMSDYYGLLYQQRLKGTSTVRGLKLIIVDYVSRNKDRCVTCDNALSVAYATG